MSERSLCVGRRTGRPHERCIGPYFSLLSYTRWKISSPDLKIFHFQNHPNHHVLPKNSHFFHEKIVSYFCSKKYYFFLSLIQVFILIVEPAPLCVKELQLYFPVAPKTPEEETRFSPHSLSSIYLIYRILTKCK